nr:hypothetical protein [Myxococcota bacterium]
MDAELKRRVDALRRPLELAAADDFAGARQGDLGNVLRIACDRVLGHPLKLLDGLDGWRTTLARWEQLDETERAICIARGMRLLARIPRPVGATMERAIEAARVEAPTPTSVKVKPAEPAAAKLTKRGAKAPAPPPAPVPVVDPLAAPTHSLPGIGPAFAERLAEKGLVTVEDLLWTLPRRYDDVRDARPLGEVCAMPEGQRATFAAQVASSRMIFARGRRWAEVRLAGISVLDGGGALVRWFNVWAGIDKRMPPGARVVLSGVVRKRGGRTEFANPDILGIDIPTTQLGLNGQPAAPR